MEGAASLVVWPFSCSLIKSSCTCLPSRFWDDVYLFRSREMTLLRWLVQISRQKNMIKNYESISWCMLQQWNNFCKCQCTSAQAYSISSLLIIWQLEWGKVSDMARPQTHTSSETHSNPLNWWWMVLRWCCRSLETVTGVSPTGGVFSILLTGTLYLQVRMTNTHRG